MVLEVDEEPLPAGWEVAMSRSKNKPYYFHARSQQVYWADAALPTGWAHQFDRQGALFYFHVRDKRATLTYERPVLRSQAPSGRSESPDEAQAGAQATLKKPNSLMDLLSPGPPALASDQAPGFSPCWDFIWIWG